MSILNELIESGLLTSILQIGLFIYLIKIVFKQQKILDEAQDKRGYNIRIRKELEESKDWNRLQQFEFSIFPLKQIRFNDKLKRISITFKEDDKDFNAYWIYNVCKSRISLKQDVLKIKSKKDSK